MAQTTNTASTSQTVNIADKVIDGGTFKMNWATGKLERCQDCPELPRGTIVHAYGAFMSYSRWAMTGNGRECVKLSENDADSYFSSPFNTLDRYAEPISKKYGIGFYYDLEATPATDSEIEAAIERGRAFLKEQEEKKEEAAREWEKGVAEVRAKYAGQFEEKPGTGYGFAVHVAKNIRKDLARNFPGCKFSVRKESYDSIQIEWTDGPTEKEVQAVAGKHKDRAERDKWNDDLWDRFPTHFTAVFGGVDYIWYRREISPERTREKKAEIMAICPDMGGNGFHYSEADKHAGYWDLYSQCEDIRGLSWLNADSVARTILLSQSFYKAPEKKEKKAGEVAPVDAKGLHLVDYSEKAVAVTGDTKQYASTLKALGGRFNFRLSCGAGWIFPKSKEQEIKKALGLAL